MSLHFLQAGPVLLSFHIDLLIRGPLGLFKRFGLPNDLGMIEVGQRVLRVPHEPLQRIKARVDQGQPRSGGFRQRTAFASSKLALASGVVLMVAGNETRASQG